MLSKLSWIALALLACAAELAGAGEDLQAERSLLRDAHRARLEELARKCDELDLAEQGRFTRAWVVRPLPDRQIFFVPAEANPSEPPPGSPRIVGQWHAKLMEHRREQAQRLFELARKALDAGDLPLSYELLHETLREDPDHAEARRILDYQRVGGRWLASGVKPVARPLDYQHPQFGWPRRGHWRVESAHFEISTNAGTKEGIQLAEALEELWVVWRQLFVRYWADAPDLAARFEGRPTAASRRKHKAALFRDEQEYLAQMRRHHPQADMTRGIYLDGPQIAFFAAGDPSDAAVWRHEAAHQLFQETGATRPEVAREAHAWIVEGAAMYLESLVRRDGYVTLGGFDAERLQHARFLAYNAKFLVPLEELEGLGRDALQRDERIRRVYSQSAGLAHFLIDHDQGRYRQGLVDHLRAIYRGGGAISLASAVERPLETLLAEYRQFLNVSDDDLARLAADQVTKLSLGFTDVSDAGLAHLAACKRLTWLDLASTAVGDEGIENLAGLPALVDLNLQNTRITDRSADSLAQIPSLEFLDLSNCAIGDAGVERLGNLKRLKTLWLINTRVSDACLATLRGLRQLEDVDLSGTKVTPEGEAALRRALPKLRAKDG